MKIRSGLISNSSSSSYIIRLKGPLTAENFTETLQSPPGHPLHNALKEAFLYFLRQDDHCLNANTPNPREALLQHAEELWYITEEDLEKYDHDRELFEQELALLEEGWSSTRRYLSYNEDSTEMGYASLLDSIVCPEGLRIEE
jgi:hypothetical protein